MKSYINFFFIGQYRTKASGHWQRDSLQEKGTNSGINLLPKNYVYGKQCKAWSASSSRVIGQKIKAIFYLLKQTSCTELALLKCRSSVRVRGYGEKGQSVVLNLDDTQIIHYN